MALADGQNADGAARLSAEDQEDVDAMNAAVDRVRTIIPTDPYILTIPQSVEPQYYHTYAFQARQWLEHTPFHYSEKEETQYQTYVFHEPDGMYKQKSTRSVYTHEETATNGELEVKGRERAGTGANTPSAAPKKKISLDAYKKKQTGVTPQATPMKEAAQPVKRLAAKGPVERLKADEEVLAAVESDDEVVPPPVEEKKELKRRRKDSLTKDSMQVAQKEDHETSQQQDQPVAKKARRTPPPEADEPKAEKRLETETPAEPVRSPEKPSLPNEKPTDESKLPPKLSPPPSTSDDSGLPPKLSPISLPALPNRLSPTIPENITATLKARAHYRSASRSSDVSVSKDTQGRTLTPPPKGITKKKSPAPRNGFRANSSSPAVRSDTEENGRPLTSVPSRVRTPEAESAEDSEEIAVAKVKKPVLGKSRSLVVKLKFIKGARERVRQLLQMKPTPKNNIASQSPIQREDGSKPAKTSDARSRGRRDTNAKGVALRVGPATNGVIRKEKQPSPEREQKRSRVDDSDDSVEPPSKRTKAHAGDLEHKEGPTTPAQSDVPSPPSVQKSNSLLTPSTMRKDVLSAAMKREQSTDSNINTPTAVSQASPPASGPHAPQMVNGTSKAPPSSQPSNKTPKQQAWESEQKRLEALGRELKHAATAHLKSLNMPHSDSTAPSNEQKLAAVKSLESLLAYILAFSCADEAALAADPKMNPSYKPWRTLHAFFGFVKRNCDAFPVMLGLSCWMGVAFNARILDLTVQHPSEGPSRDSILESQAMMVRAANDAEAKLDIDVLQVLFPRTWEGRKKGSSEALKLEPGKGFAGSYKLPLGLSTPPVRAARAGYAMLEEWLEKQEGLEYGLKLKLRVDLAMDF